MKWTDGQLPAIEYPDSISFDVTNNAYEDVAILRPISHPRTSQLGSIGGYGVAPNDIYNTVSGVRSADLGGYEDDDLRAAASNEMVPVIGLSTTVPAGGANADKELTTKYQSSSHNDFPGDTPTNFDGKYIKMTYEPTFTYDPSSGFGKLDHLLGMPPEY